MDFPTYYAYPSSVVVWIRLPNLPDTWYKRCIIRVIEETISLIVNIDFNMEHGVRGRFAQLAVSIDLHFTIFFDFKYLDSGTATTG